MSILSVHKMYRYDLYHIVVQITIMILSGKQNDFSIGFSICQHLYIFYIKLHTLIYSYILSIIFHIEFFLNFSYAKYFKMLKMGVPLQVEEKYSEK